MPVTACHHIFILSLILQLLNVNLKLNFLTGILPLTCVEHFISTLTRLRIAVLYELCLNGIVLYQEKVAELELSTYGYTLARRSDGRPVFLNESRGNRYYMEQTVVQAIAGPSNIQVRPMVVLFLYSIIIQISWKNPPSAISMTLLCI